MRLSEFITKETELITNDFELFVKTHLTGNQNLSKQVLRDHIVGVLTYVAADMKADQSADAQEIKSKGDKAEDGVETAAQVHGMQRLDVGMAITDLAAEYRALRASILKHWTAQLKNPDEKDFEDMIRFNEAIDETLGESLSRFHSLVEEARSYFLSVLGHDLRNPLSAIIGLSAILAKSSNLSDSEEYLVTQVKASAVCINTITDNLLELARVKLGTGLTIERNNADMGLLCEKSVNESMAAHPKANIILDAEGDLVGEWDEMRIGQVLSNVIKNALEHGKPQGPVQIIARGGINTVTLQIHNGGLAIPPDKIPSLFHLLKRGNDRKGTHNLGLGLYITHEIVAAHGGTVDVTSSNDAGTTFTMNFPRQDAR